MIHIKWFAWYDGTVHRMNPIPYNMFLLLIILRQRTDLHSNIASLAVKYNL